MYLYILAAPRYLPRYDKKKVCTRVRQSINVYRTINKHILHKVVENLQVR